jgi:hypothetical protein
VLIPNWLPSRARQQAVTKSSFSATSQARLLCISSLAVYESLVQKRFDVCLVRQALSLGLLPGKVQIRLRNPQRHDGRRCFLDAASRSSNLSFVNDCASPLLTGAKSCLEYYDS